MKFEITAARNGHIVKITSDEGEEEQVVSVETDGEDGTTSLVTLCSEIIEAYGPSDSRYSAKRIRVLCLPGDKHEGKIEGKYREELIELRDYINSCLEVE